MHIECKSTMYVIVHQIVLRLFIYYKNNTIKNVYEYHNIIILFVIIFYNKIII